MRDIVSTFLDGLMDWPVGTIIGSILLLLMLALVAILVGLGAAGIYHLLDYCGMPEASRDGIVRDKAFRPAYTEYIYVYNAATKTSMPTPIFHPDRWTLDVDIGIGSDSIDVSGSFYEKVTRGSPVVARYKVGRISGRINVTGVRA
ncbi:hypothetical protein KDX27_34990 [Burkholderia cenocepacia]|uniref:hypothetical protein n=1 Tax=Burkholderia cenocepacia TaxID=95486 RepID=UPI001B93DBF5|nr:hypothetical protein [Burkholderia cenocepacia]MBR8029226.1 hypothetical protein [Burkholderia cenocepacia]MBR8172936.1 hypothetical protein [Burkholderia cenocepacia]